LNRNFSIIVLCVSTLCFVLVASAGAFQVMPLRLFINPHTKTTVLRVINSDEKSLTVQLNARSWYQNEMGEDNYRDTRDIVVFPRIMTIKKGEEQIVRVGYQGEPATDRERSYRLFLTELPVEENPAAGARLIFALRLGVPIFIEAATEKHASSIEAVKLSQGQIQFQIKNNGNTHFNVGNIKSTGFNEAKSEVFTSSGRGWYVLPDKTRTFAVGVPEKGCLESVAINSVIETGESTLEVHLSEVDTAECQPPMEDIIPRSIVSTGGIPILPDGALPLIETPVLPGRVPDTGSQSGGMLK